MLIHVFTGGPVATNGYLVVDEPTRQAMVVDAPLGAARALLAWASEDQATIVLIVATHGHWDHIVDLAELHERTGAPVAVHSADRPKLEQPGSVLMPLPFTIRPVTPQRELQEGDVLELGTLRFDVLHTPGHSPGGICLYERRQGVLFAGDTLFAGSYGRTDLPDADETAMMASLRRLAALPPDVQVYSGHGEMTTIGREAAWIRRLTAGM
jgi:hydroxyacylglutathione hydrolase